jgi:hypothetical protein
LSFLFFFLAVVCLLFNFPRLYRFLSFKTDLEEGQNLNFLQKVQLTTLQLYSTDTYIQNPEEEKNCGDTDEMRYQYCPELEMNEDIVCREVYEKKKIGICFNKRSVHFNCLLVRFLCFRWLCSVQ